MFVIFERKENFVELREMFVTTIFSPSHNVFKNLFSHYLKYRRDCLMKDYFFCQTTKGYTF